MGKYLFPISYTKERILSTNLIETDSIFQSDFKGNILNKFKIKGDEPENVGSRVFCMGYLGDSSIAVIGNIGFFVYNLEGKILYKFLKKVPSRLAGGVARMRRLIAFRENNDYYVFAHWIPFIDYGKFEEINVKKEVYDKMKFLTLFNVTNSKHSTIIPFEKESIFIKENFGYNEQHLFDYNKKNKKIYSIVSPEKIVRVYDQYGNKLEKSIILYPKDFVLRKIHPFGSPKNQEEIGLFVNSEFRTLDVSEDGNFTLISYQTGIPEEEYNKIKTQAELPSITRVFNKRYIILLSSDNQNSEPILLPKDVYEVAMFKSLDYILLASNSFENPSETSFYVARLEKVR